MRIDGDRKAGFLSGGGLENLLPAVPGAGRQQNFNISSKNRASFPVSPGSGSQAGEIPSLVMVR
jgi:hypothetical protein